MMAVTLPCGMVMETFRTAGLPLYNTEKDSVRTWSRGGATARAGADTGDGRTCESVGLTSIVIISSESLVRRLVLWRSAAGSPEPMAKASGATADGSGTSIKDERSREALRIG